ncbi:MAG: ankyrin repeat domain-containing protein [Deltaproteobacteria bacterium]|nr:ankyrin repeat domain-containing protein [Deltaproteobacteria bacterium]
MRAGMAVWIVALLVALGAGACTSNYMRGTVRGDVATGVTYSGREAGSQSAPQESTRPAGELLVTGYVPIGILHSVTKRQHDSLEPLRTEAARFKGQLFTVLSANIPTDGEIHIHGTTCVSGPEPKLQESGVAAVDMTFAAGMGAIRAMEAAQCGPPTKLDIRSWFPTTTSLALVWEKGAQDALSGDVAFVALQHAILNEGHGGAAARFASRLNEMARARGDVRTQARLAATGFEIDAEQRGLLQSEIARALGEGDAEMVGWLVKAGIDPGPAALREAIEKDRRAVAKKLIEAEIALDARGADGGTALHLAVERGQLVLARRLVERGADLDAKDRKGRTPLRLAVERKHIPLGRYLLEKGAAVTPELAGLAAERCSCSLADELAARKGGGRGCTDAQRSASRAGFERIAAEMRRIASSADVGQRLTGALPEDLLAGCADLALVSGGASLPRLALDLGRLDWAARFYQQGVPFGSLQGAPFGEILQVQDSAPGADLVDWALEQGVDWQAKDRLGDAAVLSVARRLSYIAGPGSRQQPMRRRWFELLGRLLELGAYPNPRNEGKSALDLLVDHPDAAALLRRHGAR